MTKKKEKTIANNNCCLRNIGETDSILSAVSKVYINIYGLALYPVDGGYEGGWGG